MITSEFSLRLKEFIAVLYLRINKMKTLNNLYTLQYFHDMKHYATLEQGWSMCTDVERSLGQIK